MRIKPNWLGEKSPKPCIIIRNKDNKYSRENREKNLMNKFFLNNRELLNNYRKKYG